MSLFRNRLEAGQALAQLLKAFSNDTNTIVLAMPRGGVPVGFEVAKALQLPLDVLVVRKLGMPGNEELAMGAIAGENICVLDHNLINQFHINPMQLSMVTEREKNELERRNRRYRGNAPMPNLQHKNIIIVDDGIATGSSMRAAILAMKHLKPDKIIVAVPIAAPDSAKSLAKIADEIICVATPEPFYGVGMWYDQFPQTSDEEVIDLLSRARKFKAFKK